MANFRHHEAEEDFKEKITFFIDFLKDFLKK